MAKLTIVLKQRVKCEDRFICDSKKTVEHLDFDKSIVFSIFFFYCVL
jgi:hypothetical protein